MVTLPTIEDTSVKQRDTAVGVRAFKAALSRYLVEVGSGRSVTVTRRGKAVARLVPASLEGNVPSGTPDADIAAFDRLFVGMPREFDVARISGVAKRGGHSATGLARAIIDARR